MLQDVRHALRVLHGRPGVTAAAVAALALGIGANTAVFSLMDAVVLQPLPYPHPERLTSVDPTERGHAMVSTSWPMFHDWQEQNRVFEGLAGYMDDSANLTGVGEPVRVNAARITPEMFAVLGSAPLAGALDASARTAVVSYGFWMRRFGGDRAALGRTLILDGHAYTLAGVLPRGFRFPRWKFMEEPDIYLPLLPNPSRHWHYVRVIGRLKPGITLAQAQADMNVVSAAVERAQPQEGRREGAAVSPLSDDLTYGTGATLAAFAGAVLFVLIIGCVNVSNLLLGLALRRRREIAIRLALGATSARLLRQFLVETLVLALAGGTIGVLLAVWGMPLLVSTLPIHSAYSERVAMGGIGLNWMVLGFAVAVSLAATLISGTLPAWRASRQGPTTTFLATPTAKRERIRGILIAAEVSLSLVLLAGAGLLVKSFVRLLAVDPGFDTQHLLTINIELPDYKYSDVEQRAEFVRGALARLEQIPGVTSAAATNVMPLTKSSVINGFSVPGSSQEIGSAGFRAVTPGYFETMGIPLIRGRLPVRSDGAVGVINQAMARRFWSNQDPLGQEIQIPRIEEVRSAHGFTVRMTPERFRIVGIVGDVRQLTLDLAPSPEMFLLYSQMATPDFTFVLRSRIDPGTLTRSAQREILAVDRDQPLAEVHTVDELISHDVSDRRFVLLLLTVFAALAVGLAAAGIFAVVSHSVSQRTREIGIRMALGADASAVVGTMVRQTLGWVAAGLLMGVAGSLAATRVLRAYLYAVEPHDPGALVIAAAMLATISVLAAFVPARSAARIDPANTLRCE